MIAKLEKGPRLDIFRKRAYYLTERHCEQEESAYVDQVAYRKRNHLEREDSCGFDWLILYYLKSGKPVELQSVLNPPN